jgi:hypothetical protein
LESIENNRKACVFVSKEFARLFPNFDMLFRCAPEDDDIVFDCISVVDMGNYLDIVALDQGTYGGCDSVNLWIPSRFVLAVLLDPSDKKQMGFDLKRQDDIAPDQ